MYGVSMNTRFAPTACRPIRIALEVVTALIPTPSVIRWAISPSRPGPDTKLPLVQP